jgi:hypothetical protein
VAVTSDIKLTAISTDEAEAVAMVVVLAAQAAEAAVAAVLAALTTVTAMAAMVTFQNSLNTPKVIQKQLARPR